MDILVNIVTQVLSYLNPASVALVVMFVAAFYVLFQAQKRPDFDVGNFLKNENGKESVAALGALVSVILSGWCLVYVTTKATSIDADTLVTIFSIFLACWSGTKVAEKLVDAFATKWGAKSSTIDSTK